MKSTFPLVLTVLVIISCLSSFTGCNENDIIWERNFNNTLTVKGIGIHQNLLYIQTDNFLYGFERSSGREVFKLEAMDNNPVILGDACLLINSLESIIAYNPDNGAKIWEISDHIAFALMEPFIKDKKLWMAGVNQTAGVFQIDIVSGKIEAYYEYESQPNHISKNYYLDDNIIIYATKDSNNLLTLIIKNYRQNKIINRIATKAKYLQSQFTGNYILLSGEIGGNDLQIIEKSTGNTLKSYQMKKNLNILPVDENSIIVSDDNRLSLFNINHLSSFIWTFDVKKESKIQSIYKNELNRLFIALNTNKHSEIYCFDINSGKVRGKYIINKIVTKILAEKNGVIYLLSRGNILTALENR